MKNALSIACAAVIIVSVSSCSIEKRIHNRGYHISWLGNKKVTKSHDNQEDLGVGQETTTLLHQEKDENVDLAIEHDSNAPLVAERKSQEKMQEEIVSAEKPVRQMQMVTTQKSPERFKMSESSIQTQVNYISQNHNYAAENDGGGSGLSILGGILIALGLVLLLFVSLLIGVILMLVGLAFVIGGSAVKKNEAQAESKPKELQDVVYLKNGSVIRGVIIEQVPNVQVKIRTGDGSIFVYKMEEIDKMTKEEPLK